MQSRRTMTPNPAVRPSYPLGEVKRGKGRSFRRSSFEVRPTRTDINSLRLEEKAASAILRSDLGFDRCNVSSRSGFDLATAALYLLEILAQTRRSLDSRSMA